MGKIDYDYYTKMKLELVKMDLEIFENITNIMILPICCPWIVNDDNMNESISRLIDIHNSNVINLIDFISYVKKLDDSGNEFFYTDLIEEYEHVKNNMNLQTSYYDNMVRYIAFCDDVTKPWEDIETFADEFSIMDDSIFDQVQVNNSVIKMIKQERKKG